MNLSKKKPRILVLASGSKNGGGSGFREMVENSRTVPPMLDADIVAVVSNHPHGGVSKLAEKLRIKFVHWRGGYQHLIRQYQPDYVMLSGWLKLVRGLNPARTINIHPGPLPAYGGPGMYGHFVHEAVIRDFKAGKIVQSAVSMHFVNDEYDRGPIIHQAPVLIRDDDTPETLAKRVNEVERVLQSRVLNRVVHDDIFYHDGKVCYKDSNLKNEWYL